MKLLDLDKPLKEEENCSPGSSGLRSRMHNLSKSGNIEFKTCSTPISASDAYKISIHTSVGTGKRNSPITASFDKSSSRFPCVNSFYEGETPKTSLRHEGFAEHDGSKLNTKAEFVLGDSFISGQTKFSSKNGVFSRQNSFDDLFETQDPQMGDKAVMELFHNKNIADFNNVSEHNQGLDVSSQSSKEIDDIDFDDEMEVAMMYDEDEYNDNFGASKTKLAPIPTCESRASVTSVRKCLSTNDAEQLQEIDLSGSFEDPEDFRDCTAADIQHDGICHFC